jgi:hypothetical protein
MAMVRDAFTWYDSGAIAYPALHTKLIELTMPALVVKRLLPEFPLPAGRTANFVKQSGSRSAGVNRTSEGSAYPLDFTPYSYVQVTPYKVGLREKITREDIEDLYIPVIEDQLRRLARRIAYTIDEDCMIAIDAGAVGSSAGTGVTIGATGSTITVNGTVGAIDITYAKTSIKKYNFIPDTLLVNPVNEQAFENLPTFTLAAQYGGDVNAPIRTGAIGKVLGLDLFESNVVSAGTAYVISSGLNLSASYAPLGYFVIKRPLMSDIEPMKREDAVEVILSTRYAPVVLNGECIAKITGLNTS